MTLISYATIRAVERAERAETLQQLPPNFFQSAKAWLARKTTAADTVTLLELANAKRLLQDLVNRRINKIVLAALRTTRGAAPPDTLTDVERTFFDQVVTLLKNFRATMTETIAEVTEEKVAAAKKSIAQLATPAQPPRVPEQGRMQLIKILKDLPCFVSEGLTEYGPFKAGDMANLPRELAAVLIAKGDAEPALE
jgi:DNA replication factor GINS